ncbi:unnamed protein product, partial [Nesidiocoris tenuis]
FQWASCRRADVALIVRERRGNQPLRVGRAGGVGPLCAYATKLRHPRVGRTSYVSFMLLDPARPWSLKSEETAI